MNDALDPFREWDAAYVLGSLGMDERRSFERHLATCLECSNSVSELVGLPGILNKIDTASAVALIDSPVEEEPIFTTLRESSLQDLAKLSLHRRKVQRRRYSIGVSIAAGLVLVLGISIGNSSLGASTPKTQVSLADSAVKIPMVQLVPNVMTVDLRATKKRWGTAFEWSCLYTQNRTAEQMPESYDLVVTDSSGAKRVVATWLEIGEVAKGLGAATSIAFDDIRAVEVRATGTTEPIMRAET